MEIKSHPFKYPIDQRGSLKQSYQNILSEWKWGVTLGDYMPT